MNKREVDALEDKVAEEYRRATEEYQKKLEAIRLVQQMLAESNGDSATATLLEREDSSGEEIETTLLANVERVFTTNRTDIWTVQKVEKRLRQLGIPLYAKNPKPSIAVAIKKLCGRGVVRLVRKGAGRIPHKYKATEQMISAEKEEATNKA